MSCDLADCSNSCDVQGMSVLLGDQKDGDMEEEDELTGAEKKAAVEVDQKMQLLRK